MPEDDEGKPSEDVAVNRRGEMLRYIYGYDPANLDRLDWDQPEMMNHGTEQERGTGGDPGEEPGSENVPGSEGDDPPKGA